MKVLIIGAGPAGEAAVRTFRRLSVPADPVEITVVEKDHPGGLCLNKGCVPSKALLERVHMRTLANLPVDWAEIQAAKKVIVEGIRGQIESSLKTLKVKLVRGSARFRDAQSVEVVSPAGTEVVSFDKAILTTGTENLYPAPFDRFRADLLDSDRMLEVTSTPGSIAIVGGGAIGCEFACLMHAAGANVTIIEMTPSLLPGEDESVVQALTHSFESRGIVVKAGVKVTAVARNGEGWRLTLSNGEAVECEQTLLSVGRAPRFDGLALDRAGIRANGRLVLDEHLRTTNPNIFAAGDVATTRLAHAAAAQAEVAAANLLGGSKTFDGRFVPRCLYSWPEVASVGAWKYELEKAGEPVKTRRAFFRASSKALAAGEPEGFVQIVSDGAGRLRGAQIIGAHATDLIHIFSVALKAEMTVEELGEVMFAHPTLSELIRDAARK